ALEAAFLARLEIGGERLAAFLHHAGEVAREFLDIERAARPARGLRRRGWGLQFATSDRAPVLRLFGLRFLGLRFVIRFLRFRWISAKPDARNRAASAIQALAFSGARAARQLLPMYL